MPYQSASELLGGTGDPLGRLLVDQATHLGIQGPRDGARCTLARRATSLIVTTLRTRAFNPSGAAVLAG